MTAPFVYTYGDVLESLDAYASGMATGANQSVRRMCVERAYREVIRARSWSCLKDVHFLQLRAPQTTGTVAFDLTGGTYERQLTLTGTTWPSAWVRDGCVRLGSPEIVCEVEDYKTTTVITLEAATAPIADITSTTYSLFPKWYALPNDFLSMDLPMDEDAWILGHPTTKAEIERLIRYDSTTGSIERYAVAQAPGLYGTMALFIYPPSDASETLAIPYKKRARALLYTGHDGTIDCAGTVTLTSGSPTVTGSSTAFESGMAGAILRTSTSTTRPTGTTGQYRYAEQYSIKSVESATSLTLTSNATTSRSGKGYSISDPVDFDEAVYDAFLACCEKHLARVLRSKNFQEAEREYERALRRAKAADNRDDAPAIAGSPGRRWARPADSSTSNRSLVEGLD